MHKAITGATGFIGQAIVDHWIKQGDTITVIGRNEEKIRDIFHNKVNILTWQNFPHDTKDTLKNVEVILNLAGVSIAQGRWIPQRKKEIIASRIQATQSIVQYCQQHKEKNILLLNTSAVGIYGPQKQIPEQLPPALDEDSPIAPPTSPDFLSSVCRQWEEEAQKTQDFTQRVVFLRLGVVLGKNGGALPKMILPFRLFAGGPLGKGYQPVPWVMLEDVTRAIEFIIHHQTIEGPVNIVAPHCIYQRDLACLLGNILHRPSCIPTPGFILKIILGQMAEELLLEGQNVYPKKLLENGFTFQYEKIENALKSIFNKKSV